VNKNRFKYLGVVVIIVVFAIIFIPEIISRIQKGDVVRSKDLQKQTSLAYITLNGEKRKIPTFEFYNQDSLLITEKDLLGKVYVVEFFFSTCPTICPVMNKNLVIVQNQFKESNYFGIASFSINPEHDTPEVLKSYADRYGITDIDWHLLSGPMEDVYELANSGFNIYAQETPGLNGGFEHSGLFALVDKDGYLRSRRDEFGNPIVYYRGAIDKLEKINDIGETEQISILIEDIEKLLKE
jgi:protein SCO1/2